MVIYEVAANDYEKMSDLAHGLKKMACKLAKCLENLEDQGEEWDEEDDYEEEEDDQVRYRRGLRYRNESMDPSRMQDPNDPNIMEDTNGNTVVKTRRGRNARGQYTSMRSRSKRMPRSRYDIEVY